MCMLILDIVIGGRKMLRVNNISKKYKDLTVFSDISFEVKKGDVVAITGSSGCGKSTLLKCINRLEEIDNGEIYFENINIKDLDLVLLRQNIGIVFQEYNLFEHMTVLENLIIGLTKIKKISERAAIREAKLMLEKIGLIDKLNSYPDELSGGQKQRVAIARTLLMNPKMLLLDEPTSALDREMKEGVLKLISKLAKEGMTIIIVSHEEEFINKIADKIIKISKNKIKYIR